VLDTVFAAPVYAWAGENQPLIAVRGWWDRLGDWLADARVAHPAVFRAMIFALTAVLVAIVVHAAYVFLRTLRAASRREGAAVAGSPVALRRGAGWYLQAADAAAAAGRYREALSLAFVALIFRLDGLGSVRWGPGKTAREYALEARLEPADRQRLGGVVGTLYGCVYGGAPCGAAEFRALRGLATGDWHAAAD
jgi:uncharacterized protein DUF4129